MKKLISICILCMFVGLGSMAANTSSLIENIETKKVTVSLLATESNLENIAKGHIEPFTWWCRVIDVQFEIAGEDMYGNIIVDVTYTIECIYIDMTVNPN